MTDPATSRSGRMEVRVVPKPWGNEVIWAETELYLGKLLNIKAGHSLSVQYHQRKDECVHLISGELVYRVGTDEKSLEDVGLKPGESYRIAPGTVHQMEAITDCKILEVSTPYPDDVVRLKDRYGREGTSAP